MNIVLLIAEIVLTFSMVLAMRKWFGKEGLFVWVSVATVLANIMTAKTVTLAGLDTTLGTVLFASTFLCTDILTECYSKRDATKAVKLGTLSAACFIVASQIALAYIPSPIDYANESMKTLFGLNLRISLASITMYFIANYVDVLVYDKLKSKMGGKKLWIRNNISTILCNGLENFAFIWLAFAGIYSGMDIIIIAGSTTLIEIIVAICDTPFLYIAKNDSVKAQNLAYNKRNILY